VLRPGISKADLSRIGRTTEGETLIDDQRYAALRHPLPEVGALLDAKALHPRRSARNHVVAMARATESRSNGATRCSTRWAWRRAATPAGQRVDAPIDEIIAGSSPSAMLARVPDPAGREVLCDRLAGDARRGWTAGVDELVISGTTVEHLAHSLGVRLHQLRTQEARPR
jgi:hypothetical protein